MIDLKEIKHNKWKPSNGLYCQWVEARDNGTFRCREWWNGKYEEEDITFNLRRSFWKRLREEMK